MLKQILDTLNGVEKEQLLKCESLLKEKVSENNELVLKLDYSYNIVNYLFTLQVDFDTILAGFLHYFYNQKIICDQEILSCCSEETLSILSTLDKVENTEHVSKQEEAENIRNMFVAMAKDMRVIIVKLADIRESLINIKILDENKKQTLLNEVRDIYSPLAERLGLNSLKGDLEDLLFKNIKPVEYEELTKLLNERLSQRTNEIKEVTEQLENVLKELKIDGLVYGRQKRISSVYKKIKNKTNSLDNIYDLVALRIIVDNIEQCYSVLGKIHTLFVPLNNRFKDYIALPKQNGYQSLHTTVLNKNNQPFEIQIRTKDMHEYAEYGVAAHWVYKEGGKTNSFDMKFGWLRKMMEESKDLTAEEFVEVLKTDIFSGQIFVQSPMGKVISFPEGATPIDFAFAIHSNIGEHCVGAKVNGKMCPLTSKLNNGDTVEIITSNQSKGPSRDWLNYVVSTGAKSKIKAYFKREMKDENIKKGKLMLETSAKNKGLQLYKLLTEECLNPLYKRYKFSSLDEVYASLGFGGVTTSQVLNKLSDTYQKLHKDEIENEELENTTEQVLFKSKNDADAIIVKGENNMLTRFAKCCNPIPGDNIIGFVSRGRGVTIHRLDCVNVPYLDKNRLIKCSWQESKVSSFLASIRIIAVNSMGTLSEISKEITNNKINIQSIQSKPYSKDKTYIDLTVTLNKKEQLSMLINSLKKCKCVIDAFRSSAKE